MRDPVKVEEVKTLRRLNRTWPQVASQTGLSVSTCRRYAEVPDTAEQEDERDKWVAEFSSQGSRIVKNLLDIIETATLTGDLKPKDAAIMTGIIVDKLELVKARRKEQSGQPLVRINLVCDGRTLPDAGGLPYLEGEVQGDDMRTGGGEDLRRLPGGGPDGS